MGEDPDSAGDTRGNLGGSFGGGKFTPKLSSSAKRKMDEAATHKRQAQARTAAKRARKARKRNRP